MDENHIGWMYEDKLPDSLTESDYSYLYPFSRIHLGVRMFPRYLVYDRINSNSGVEFKHKVYDMVVEILQEKGILP